MDKDFDRWNSRKKLIDSKSQPRTYHTREIWWCTLGLNVGFEQNGKGDTYERPVLILKGLSRSVCVVLPLTTSMKDNPYHESVGVVGGKKAFAIISQIRLIDSKRLINKIDIIPQERFEVIRKAVKNIL